MNNKNIKMEIRDRRNDEEIENEGDVFLGIIAKEEKEEDGYTVEGIILGEAPRNLVLEMAARIAFSAIENTSDDTVEILLSTEKFTKQLSKYITQKLREDKATDDEFAEEYDH